MTRRRWIADEVAGNRAVLTGSHAHHLARVLRAQVGQEFDIAASGVVRRGRVARIEPGRVEFELGEAVPAAARANISLALSIFKFDRMEWAIEKCTELGAARILPVIARRTDPHLAKAAVKRVERWQRVARQAAEQSRRLTPPQILQPVRVAEAAGLAGGTRIVLDESETQVRLRDAVDTPDLILALGPEGGWTNEEVHLFRGAGWKTASLGKTILRAETAAVAAMAVVMAVLE